MNSHGKDCVCDQCARMNNIIRCVAKRRAQKPIARQLKKAPWRLDKKTDIDVEKDKKTDIDVEKEEKQIPLGNKPEIGNITKRNVQKPIVRQLKKAPWRLDKKTDIDVKKDKKTDIDVEKDKKTDIDVEEEELQIALALSKSSYDMENIDIIYVNDDKIIELNSDSEEDFKVHKYPIDLIDSDEDICILEPIINTNNNTTKKNDFTHIPQYQPNKNVNNKINSTTNNNTPVNLDEKSTSKTNNDNNNTNSPNNNIITTEKISVSNSNNRKSESDSLPISPPHSPRIPPRSPIILDKQTLYELNCIEVAQPIKYRMLTPEELEQLDNFEKNFNLSEEARPKKPKPKPRSKSKFNEENQKEAHKCLKCNKLFLNPKCLYSYCKKCCLYNNTNTDQICLYHFFEEATRPSIDQETLQKLIERVKAEHPTVEIRIGNRSEEKKQEKELKDLKYNRPKTKLSKIVKNMMKMVNGLAPRDVSSFDLDYEKCNEILKDDEELFSITDDENMADSGDNENNKKNNCTEKFKLKSQHIVQTSIADIATWLNNNNINTPESINQLFTILNLPNTLYNSDLVNEYNQLKEINNNNNQDSSNKRLEFDGKQKDLESNEKKHTSTKKIKVKE